MWEDLYLKLKSEWFWILGWETKKYYKKRIIFSVLNLQLPGNLFIFMEEKRHKYWSNAEKITFLLFIQYDSDIHAIEKEGKKYGLKLSSHLGLKVH